MIAVGSPASQASIGCPPTRPWSDVSRWVGSCRVQTARVHEGASEGGQLAPISPIARLACGAVPTGSASVPVGELCSVSPPGETGIASCLERVEHQSASAAVGAGACGSSACTCVLTCAFGCASACVRRRECTHDPPPLCSPLGGGEGAAPSSYRLLYLRGLEGGGGI